MERPFEVFMNFFNVTIDFLKYFISFNILCWGPGPFAPWAWPEVWLLRTCAWLDVIPTNFASRGRSSLTSSVTTTPSQVGYSPLCLPLWPYVNQHLKQRRCIATILWQFTSHLTVYHTSESHRDHVSTKDNTEMDTVCAPFTQKQKNCNWYLFFTNLINITTFVLEFGGALRFWCWNKKYYSSILIFLLPNPS